MRDADTERRPSRLRQLLNRADARPRVVRAVSSLLGVSVLSIAVVGALFLWHVRRRGRLIRERLALPRDVRLPDLTPGRDQDSSKATLQ